MQLSTISLALTRLGGAGAFDPSSLFAGGTVAGAWYDPSDLTTLFDSSAGTTQCAMPGQGSPVPVGLMLDKSQGLVLGPQTELVTNGTFNTDIAGWTFTGGGGSAAWNAGTARITGTSSVSKQFSQGISVVAGKSYTITGTVTPVSGTLSASLTLRTTNDVATSAFIAGQGFSASGGTVNFKYVAPTTTTVFVCIQSFATISTFDIDNISIVEWIQGNHAIAFNDTTARPELSARVNLLTYSEEFDNADWLKYAVAVSANAGVAPNGTTTADLIYPSVTGTFRSVYRAFSGANSISVSAKASGKTWISMMDLAGSSAVAWFDVANGVIGTVTAGYTAAISSQGSGWYRCTLVANSGTFAFAQFNVVDGNGTNTGTANGTDGVLLWGADGRPANIGANVPAYQRIADANTYDTSGFPLYLYFDGADDGMNVPGSASAMKFMHSALSSVCLGVNVGISADPNAIYAFFGSNALASANVGATCAYDDRSSISINNALRNFTTNGVSGFPTISTLDQNALLPITPNVVFYNSDPANATAANRYTAYVNNGSALATNTLTDSASTANSTYNLQIAASGNSLDLALMRFYGLVIVNATITGGQRTATQSWIAGKMGITLP